MKRALGVAVLSLAFVVPAFAAPGDQQPGPGPSGKTFEERQANILKFIDQRIEHLQEGKACVQAATNDDDLRACREKQRAEMRDRRGNMGGPGMMGDRGPRGQQ